MKLEDIGFYTLEDERAKNTSVSSPLWRCELLLTNKCNFNCPYCRGTESDANISFEQAKKIIDLWSSQGLKNVRFSGGEPTCVDWLIDLVLYAKKSGIEKVAISTNGSRDIEYYFRLYYAGVRDFSISLDACCGSFADSMSGVCGVFNNIVSSIRYLSKLTYVTVGCVFDETNVKQSLETVLFADSLGVHDIRIISAAQYNQALDFVKMIPHNILDKYPILNYRVNNFLAGRNVRGISKHDNHKCPLVLDDMAIRGDYHYPCIIHMREGGKPISKVGDNMRIERYEYYIKHDTHKDNICRKNCLDVCVDYNNKVRELQGA